MHAQLYNSCMQSDKTTTCSFFVASRHIIIRGVKNVITSPSSPDSGTNVGGVIAGIVLVLLAAIVITVIVTWKLAYVRADLT